MLQDLRVNDDILERLQAIGVVSPCHVVNSFGLSEARITETFLHLGYYLLTDSKTKEACQIFVMFGRSQTLRTRMNAEPNMDWTPYAVTEHFNDEVENWTSTEETAVKDFIKSTDECISAQHLMKCIRKRGCKMIR